MDKQSKSYKYITEREKRKVTEIDNAIEALERDFHTLDKHINKTEKGWALMEAKLRKERLVALTAVSKFKLLIAKMEIYIAENDLTNRNLARYENREFNLIEDNSPSTSQVEINRAVHPISSISSGSTSGHSSRRESLSLDTSVDKREFPSKYCCDDSSQSSLSSLEVRNTRNLVEVMPERRRIAPERSSSSMSAENFNHMFDSQYYQTWKEPIPKSSMTSLQRTLNPNDTKNQESSVPIMPLGNTNSSNVRSETQNSLTDSIIEEFRESFSKVMAQPIISRNKLSNDGISRKRKKSSKENVSLKRSCIYPSATDTSLSSQGRPRNYPTPYSSITETSVTPLEAPHSSSQEPTHLTESRSQNILAPDTYTLTWPDTSTVKFPEIGYVPTVLSPRSQVFNTEIALPTRQFENTPKYESTPQYEFVSDPFDTPSPSQKFFEQVQFEDMLFETPKKLEFLCKRKRHIAVPEAPIYRSKLKHRRYADGTGCQGKNPESGRRKKKAKRELKVKLADETKYNRTLSQTEVCFYNSS